MLRVTCTAPAGASGRYSLSRKLAAPSLHPLFFTLAVSSLLQSNREHEGERTRARPLCASCGTIGRPTRAFGSLLIAAHPQSTVPLPAARTRRGNTSWAQVPGVDGARLPGLVLHRRLRTGRPTAFPSGGRTRAGQNNCLPNHRRGLSRARSPAGSRERRVAFGSSAPSSAAALPHLWVLASGLARRAASGAARPSGSASPPPAKKPDRPHAPRRWPARSASGGWDRDAGLMRWRCGARRWRAPRWRLALGRARLPSLSRCRRARYYGKRAPKPVWPWCGMGTFNRPALQSAV